MIYLHHEDKIVFINEDTHIEREKACIFIYTKSKSVKFQYSDEDLAIEAFNSILQRLNNYSPAYGINI